MTESKKFSEALEYHLGKRPGKIQVVPTKPTATQHDLSMAYTPGVAEPCMEIHRDPATADLYTSRANLVAVVSNGSAVLGLGNIGALAGKPVMEGKGVLFKRFADIDVFDIELDTQDPEEIIRTVQLLEPTFGGINLEDIKAPECFLIEQRLKETMDIPVFHDDQHGTAIIAGAGFLNALELTQRKIEDCRVVVSGAGAAGIACTKFLVSLGLPHGNVIMVDSKGVIHSEREDELNEHKAEWAIQTKRRSLADALKDADCFLGVSLKDLVTEEMVKSMAAKPIVFAMANPDPEIPYPAVLRARKDAIAATGRSDYPNQVNNVLGFPFIFRGALDVRATRISDGMKVAAAHALANLAREDVPEAVLKAYNLDRLEFGSEYIIPKPFDPRVLWTEAPAVAQAATEEGLARKPLLDVEEYREALRMRFQASHGLMHSVTVKAQRHPMKVVYPYGDDPRVVRAAVRVVQDKIAHPVLLGRKDEIYKTAQLFHLDLDDVTILDPEEKDERHARYADAMFQYCARKGVTPARAPMLLRRSNTYAAVMLRQGDVDAMVGGAANYYAETISPALQILDLEKGRSVVSAVFILLLDGKPYFLADCGVNIMPSAEELAEIALSSAEVAREFNVRPRVAMISYSNFGSAKGEEVYRVRKAIQICHEKDPKLILDGEMHADTAVVDELLQVRHPFSMLHRQANVLVFPNLTAANAAYKLLQRLGKGEVIGPILTGFAQSVHVLQRNAEVGEIVNLTAIAVLDAQRKKGEAD